MKKTPAKLSKLEHRLSEFFKLNHKEKTVCSHDIIKGFDQELTLLKQLIKDYDVDDCPKVKRFGLPIFTKDLLVQNYEYLQSLFTYRVQKDPEAALSQLFKALRRPFMLYHDSGKKILILMKEIL